MREKNGKEFNRETSAGKAFKEKAFEMRAALLALIVVFSLFGATVYAGGTQEAGGDGENDASPKENGELTLTDAMGREVTVPKNPQHIICSGAGALRLAVYLEQEGKVVAVDDMETRRPKYAARPYAIAHPEFKEKPTFGEFRGHDNPELIVSLDPQPQVIFKTFPQMGTDPRALQRKTGIPVVVLSYGDLFELKEDLFDSLRLMGGVLDAEKRAEEVIRFFEEAAQDLSKRTEGVSGSEESSSYVGGIAFKGPHGFRSTEPAYPPFRLLDAKNVAYDPEASKKTMRHANVSKEKIVMWDPDVVFLDISTLQADPQSSAVYQLRNDPAYEKLTAVAEGRVYGVFPYNWYTRNFGSILADAYFIGSVLYPERFADVEPMKKAEEIFRFLVGEPVADRLNENFDGLGFGRIPVQER